MGIKYTSTERAEARIKVLSHQLKAADQRVREQNVRLIEMGNDLTEYREDNHTLQQRIAGLLAQKRDAIVEENNDG